MNRKMQDRITAENSALIKEINQLRRELQLVARPRGLAAPAPAPPAGPPQRATTLKSRAERLSASLSAAPAAPPAPARELQDTVRLQQERIDELRAAIR